MAPGTLLATHEASASDADLTSTALKHKIDKINDGSSSSNGAPAPAELDASKLIFTRTTAPRAVPDEATASAGQHTICTDHMISCAWNSTTGWAAPELKPYGPISLMPTASVLHYATECFEGLKAYRGFDGKLRLFRPDCNARRLLSSAVRIALPAFPPAEVEKLLAALVATDGPKWLPRDRAGSYLYLRPVLIGTQPHLGIGTPTEALLYITASFMTRFDARAGGIRLHTNPEDTIRAWVGGFGHAKLGANYGPSLVATQEARRRGYDQVLWLYGPEGYCTEAGASNFFVVWKSKETGRPQIVTAPLDDKLILDGITRRSLLQLARERLGDEAEVVERRYSIDEVVEADREGRLIESFAAGTAFFVAPVSFIHHRGKDIAISMAEGNGGKYTLMLRKWMHDIMYGNENHSWGVTIPEEE
ncbi:putative branched-chain amino acids aminotransferase [Cryphonectria parasitica EP155]|uniref:Branched-chain-amino-acid aminotransferase n=1 Tax=Cryphonectria parasitica (strain ATCC 38755 / EP155) TaxID=660469 RepID=A0A9P5CK41_CRYP1|nr:putative branched-chain amino acids aminotransferase [Cryphonectria parasitica EP155]KAF3760772.1 putative branched-chain amino acids aminotransferase [Cryphonectria parasitica EP155]